MDGSLARRTLAEQARVSIATVLPWIGAIYGLLGVLYLVAPPLQPGTPYVASTLTVAALQVLLGIAVRRVSYRYVHAVGLVAALLAIAQALMFVVLTGDPSQTVVLVIVLLGSAFEMLAYWTALTTVAIGVGAWIVLAHDFPAPAFVHWFVNLIGTALLALVISAARIRAARRQVVTEHALRCAKDAAEVGARVKSDFLATISHEIRTPLNGIFGMTELALDTTDDDERREFLQRARACAATLMSLLNDVLDFSRVEAGRLELERIELDPRDVVDGVLDALALEAERKGLELVGSVDERLPITLLGDPGRLRQILINLAGNALKFTEHGEVVVHLGVDAATPEMPETHEVMLRATVHDTGIGIAPDKQRAIFEAFTQADSSMTRRFGGTGLGLAISQRLVALMGGAIGVASEAGEGSRFWFTARQGVGGPPIASAGPPLDGLRVAIVSANAASAAALAHTVQTAGGHPFVVTGVTQLVTAIAAAADAASDLEIVVIDLAASQPTAAWQLAALEREAPNLPPLVVLAPSTARPSLRALAPHRPTLLSKPTKMRTILTVLAGLRAEGVRPFPASATVQRHASPTRGDRG